MKNPPVFLDIPCLTEISNPISAKELVKKWFKGGKTRLTNEGILQDFIRLNSSLFSFLDVTPIITGSYNDLELAFRSGNYIGAIPLKSPVTGKPFADYIVHPRYLSDSKNKVNEYIEIIYLLEENISPEFFDSHELLTKNHVRPPIYYECIKFIDLFLTSIKAKWVKFDSKEEYFDYPKGRINWNKYLERESDPFHKLNFPCQINWLNKFHDGIRELLYVYELSKELINDQNTPVRIKSSIKKKFIFIDKLFSDYEPIITNKILIRNSDPEIIKQTKVQANKILINENSLSKAWRVDFSDIFEKYVQFLFTKISLKAGWATKSNLKFINVSHNAPSWGLKYLEPDLLIYKGKKTITVDAKYKSHLLSPNSFSDYLKEEHRFDLHQITAYCAFQSSESKVGFLCYPSTFINSKRLDYRSYVSSTDVVIYLIGIPITSSGFQIVKSELEKLFFDIVKTEKLF